MHKSFKIYSNCLIGIFIIFTHHGMIPLGYSLYEKIKRRLTEMYCYHITVGA